MGSPSDGIPASGRPAGSAVPRSGPHTTDNPGAARLIQIPATRRKSPNVRVEGIWIDPTNGRAASGWGEAQVTGACQVAHHTCGPTIPWSTARPLSRSNAVQNAADCGP